MPRRIKKNNKSKKTSSSGIASIPRELNKPEPSLSATRPTVQQLSDEILSSRLGNCASLSQEESMGICEAILDTDDEVSVIIESLSDYLDISSEDAREMFKRVVSGDANSDNELESGESDNDDGSITSDISCTSVLSAESDYLQEGECEMCERDMKTTRHHLIPKFTWKYMRPRFISAAKSYEKGDLESVKEILGMDFSKNDTVKNNDFLHRLTSSVSPKSLKSGISIKIFLGSYTAIVCSKCHSCIHRNIDHDELTRTYYTVDKLMEHKEIYKFCKYIHTQRPGKHKRLM